MADEGVDDPLVDALEGAVTDKSVPEQVPQLPRTRT